MDLTLSDQDLAFREEVRAFLDEALTPELRRAGERTTSDFSDYDASLEWQRILYEKGWLTADWPEEYGGTGWTLSQRAIFREECARANAPVILYFSLLMIGPILMEYGTGEQKAELLPRMLSGEDLWCQGYSEPNAGSDLASLQTRAVRQGDDYIVNGSKIWTSYAHRANRIFCLVRTSTEGKPQAGISFLLIDMESPGVKVEPITGNDGEVEQCQVFFDDVRVPVSNLVGKENQGWEIAKYLLEFERGIFCHYPTLEKHIRLLRQLAQSRLDCNGTPYSKDPLFQARLAELDIDKLALEFLEHRIRASISAGANPGPLSSVVKVVGAELLQRIEELSLEVRGMYLAPMQNEVLAPDYDGPTIGPAEGVTLMNQYLNHRAATLYGGSSQIQRNIIAKVILGL